MHANLSELDDLIVQNHRTDRALFDELTTLQREHGILHDERPICPFLRPYFLGRTTYDRVARAASVLSGAFERLTEAALADPTIARELGLTEKELLWARLEPGYGAVSASGRLDAYLNGSDFAFLEYNAENPAGIGDQTSFEQLFRRVPEVAAFLDRTPHSFPQPHVRLLETLRSVYREYGGERRPPSIAIVDWAGVSTESEFFVLKEFFEASGHESAIVDPHELEYDGEVLRAGGFVVDIFYKRVIIHEFLDRFDEEHPVYRAGRDGAVCMANSFRSKIPHKKASFAVLSDPRFSGLFTPEQLRAIARHIPWTRRIQDGRTTIRDERVDLVDFVRRERERLVLKPNDDYGGKGVKLGWECSESEWDAAIGTALAGDHVVQERVAPGATDIPAFANGEARMQTLNVDFDPFLFCGSVEGGLVRLSASSVVNVTQGGGETALAILEDL
jgi:hypothetical protein